MKAKVRRIWVGISILGLISAQTFSAPNEVESPSSRSGTKQSGESLDSNSSDQNDIVSKGWSANDWLLGGLDSFGKAWKIRLGCEFLRNGDYSATAIKELDKCRPADKANSREAAEALRRLFAMFNVSFGETKPPVMFVEDVRLKKPLLRQTLDVPAFEGKVSCILQFLRDRQFFLTTPLAFSFPDPWPMDWARPIRVPAMKTTLGGYLATALFDEKNEHGISFCLITSPTGVLQYEAVGIINGKPGKVILPIEALLYVQRKTLTGPKSKGGNSK